MAIFKQVESGINPYAEDYMATKIAYILRPEAILSNYWGGYGFVKGTLQEVTEQFYIVRNLYHKSNYIPLRHFVLSFDPYYEYDITPFQAYQIAKKVCKIFADAQYQVIFSVHENTNHLHVHILVNTIDLTNGMLYNCDMHNFYAVRQTAVLKKLSEQFCNHTDYGMEIIHYFYISSLSYRSIPSNTQIIII